jgi:hypothetical protein
MCADEQLPRNHEIVSAPGGGNTRMLNDFQDGRSSTLCFFMMGQKIILSK